jgi:hypothetical protein
VFGYDLKPYELFGYPFFFGLLAVVIARAFPSPEMNVFFWAFEINVAFLGLFYQYTESTKYVDGQATSKPVATQEERPTRANETLPRIQSGGMELYSQGVESVNVNAVKAFNLHIITQHGGGLPVIMTENYWTKKEPGMEQSRWVKIGGTGPTDWKDMMGRGLAWGAYKTEGGQDKRVINSERKISQLAQGYPLPTWEQLKNYAQSTRKVSK